MAIWVALLACLILAASCKQTETAAYETIHDTITINTMTVRQDVTNERCTVTVDTAKRRLIIIKTTTNNTRMVTADTAKASMAKQMTAATKGRKKTKDNERQNKIPTSIIFKVIFAMIVFCIGLVLGKKVV